ncbi:hypothetical protein STEG23_029095 [Scotinomys teguina]
MPDIDPWASICAGIGLGTREMIAQWLRAQTTTLVEDPSSDPSTQDLVMTPVPRDPGALELCRSAAQQELDRVIQSSSYLCKASLLSTPPQ